MSVVALLGLVWHLVPPSDPPREKAAPETTPDKSDKKTEEKKIHEGPWIATCRFFGKDAGSPKPKERPDFCWNKDQVPAATVMSATIPDPSKTRLGLFTDRAIDSLQMGARAAGWEYDSQWLPWKFAEDENQAGEKRWLPRDARIAEPGLLIFRKGAQPSDMSFPRRLLLVFVAGETPTAGIDNIAFQKILQYRAIVEQDLGDKKLPPFDIAGPTFSGSLPSLAFALKGRQTEVGHIYSGTVTYAAYANTFRHDTDIDFHSATQDSATTTNQLRAVAQRLGIGQDQIAILSEDETAFGASLDPQGDLVNIPFPREISSLRNATQSDGSSVSNTNPGSAGRVPFSLRDADGGEDSVPLFGHSQTALSQYSTVTAIVNRIRGHFKLVEIAATNVLDSLFLATVLHDGAPDTRVLVPTADLLFIRAAREQSLTGILALTNYPLFLPNQNWTNDTNKTIVFSDGNSEGLYNAMYLLLANADRDHCPHPSLVCDYDAPTAPFPSHPVAWLAESTATGYWPITVFRSTGSFPPLEHGQFLVPGNERLPLPRQWWVLAILAIASTLILSWAIWRAGFKKNLTHFEIFRTPLLAKPGRESHAHAAFAIFALACCLGLLAALILPAAIEDAHGQRLLMIASGLAALAALSAVGKIIWSGCANAASAPVLCLLAAIPAAICVPFFQTADRNLLVIRYLEIPSGCSAAVPLVLILLGLLFGSLLHMNRLSMACYRNSHIPDRGLQPMVQRSLRFLSLHS